MLESKVQYDVHHLNSEIAGQRKVLASLGNRTEDLLKELKNHRRKQKDLIHTVRHKADKEQVRDGDRTLMINDGRIILPMKDFQKYGHVLDEWDRRKRGENIQFLNRLGESVQKRDFTTEFYDKNYNQLPSLDRYQMYKDSERLNQSMPRSRSDPYFGSMYGYAHPQRVNYINPQTYNLLSQSHMM